MEAENLIPARQFCIHYNIEYAFIDSLCDYGLIEIVTVQDTLFIRKEQVKNIEKMMRLHYDLDINLEGIDAIAHLLQRVDELQNEILSLRNRLGKDKDELSF